MPYKNHLGQRVSLPLTFSVPLTHSKEASMAVPLDLQALNTLFTEARTHSHWQDKAVDSALLHRLYELVSLAPTSANASPGRFVFITSASGKEKLKPALSSGNVEKTLSAPVTVIVASDSKFYDRLPELFP